MITFSISIIVLVLGYVFYSKFVEKVFGADEKRKTPAYTSTDNVDYMPMNTAKAYLIQFLDIAGLGPIFGAILGATYGPVAFLWIVIGAIIGGGVHDYMSGMMSVRQNGESIAEVIGKWLGVSAKQFMRFFTLFLMILVGAAFIMGPSAILSAKLETLNLTGFWTILTNKYFWVVLILGYYFVATLLPIDKIIGKIYPLFGLALLFMALGIGIALFFHGVDVPELTFENLRNMKTNAEQFPIFPLIFITISCGAISGFHSTQSPLMARTIKNEKKGRQVFYGAMITEAIVALIWAAAAMTFFGGVGELNAELAAHEMQPAWFVNLISNQWLGVFGGILAIFGVVAAPITTGDTALRSARLIIADFTNFKQNKIKNRLIITVILFVVVYAFTLIKFDMLWRLMFWFNQVLATFVFWGITVYLAKKHRLYWISLIPAIFMTAVVITYLFIAKEALNMNHLISYIIGISTTVIITVFFFYKQITKFKKEKPVVD